MLGTMHLSPQDSIHCSPLANQKDAVFVAAFLSILLEEQNNFEKLNRLRKVWRRIGHFHRRGEHRALNLTMLDR